MSVEISWNGELCIISADGRVVARDVTTASHALASKAEQLGKKLVVLAIVNGRLRMPTAQAKREMRVQREALRNSCAEVHVVLQRSGLLGELGLLFGQAMRLLRASSLPVHFYRDEAQARRALSLHQGRAPGVSPAH